MIKTILPSFMRIVKRSLQLAILLLISVTAAAVRGDSTDGTTPLALKPGAPAGSYALSDLDNINPYNGSLNFRLPLLSIGGRGGAAYTMTLPIEQKWRINVTPIYQYVYEDGGGPPLPDPEITYLYFPSANWWSGIKPGFGPGVLQGRVAQVEAQVCPDGTMRATLTLTRLTFSAPDGTEFELRDKLTDGTAAGVGLCDANGFNRGKIFVTADGSAATFISDQNIIDYIWMPNAGNDLFYPSGYLLMRDGTRYRFDNGTVSWLRDRNGNRMTFTYDSFKRVTNITDSLNRQVTVTYATTSVAYDEIVYKGFGGAQRTVRVNYANLGDPGSLRTGYSTQTYYQLFPIVGSSMSGTYNPKVVRSVTLPNNQQYQFQYNSYGELAHVVLPTGGAFEYDHAEAAGTIAGGVTGEGETMSIFRRVITRRVYADGSTLSNKTTFSQQQSAGGNTSYTLIDQFGSDGVTRLNQKKVYHEGFALNSLILLPTEYSPWKEGRETQADSIAADGSTVLNRIVRTWQQPIGGATWPLTQPETNAAAKPNNPQVTQVLTTLEPAQANKVAKQTFTFDKYTNRTDVYEYDFGTGVAGALVRRTRTDFLTASYDTLNPSQSSPDMNLTAHIRSLPTQVSVFDAGGVERARSSNEYDNYVLDGANCASSFHCPLLARSNISGLDSNFTTSYTKRGNPTASTRYLLVGGSVTGSVSSYSHYDVAGNVLRVIDPRSTPSNIIATNLEYDDRFGAPNNEARANSAPAELAGLNSFAFATKVTNALGHTAYAQFDYYLGQPVNGEDANGVVAGGFFNDSLDRPMQVRRAIGTTVENQTTFAYDDANRTVTTSSDRDANNDNLLVAKVLYDQLGRTIEARQYEGGTNYIVTQTQYDALGRPFKTSNPFRPWQSETAVWTTQAFDALGRVISVTTPDSSVMNTSYSGNTVTVTDQALKKRKSVSDALGRLKEVYEDPDSLNYLTSYQYDALDNLVKVTQGTQQRFFMYDSLRRLIRARNPEQGTLASLNLTDPITLNSAWSMSYQYDAGSNVTSRTDARGVVTDNLYDALNRVTTTLYRVNGQPDPNTGDIEYLYDNAPYGKGRLWLTYRWGAKPSHSAVGLYDALGRVTQFYNLFGDGQGGWSAGYPITRTYNRAGGVTSQTYPSGRTVTFNYDSAGRLADKDAQNLAYTGNLGDGVQRTYSRGLSYTPAGQLQQEQFGTTTPVYNKLRYNSRLQLAEMLVSTTGGDNSWNRGKILNQYSLQCSGAGCNATDNNGNLRKQEVFIPANDQVSSYSSWYQQYDYDSLNRLKRVHEYTGTPQLDWQQEYLYDRWGNRRIDVANTYGTGINNRNFEKEDATNRLYAPGDLALADNLRQIRYDIAGNQIKDTYTGYGNATYDGDNRIVAIQDNLAGWTYYTYNANGQRVRRKIGNQETWQIYGIDGELVAEYPANGAESNPQKEYGYRNGQLLIVASAPTGTNQSLSLNGTSAYVQAPSSSSLNITGAITVEAWVKINAIGAYRAIVSREAFQQAGTGGGYRLAITDTGKVRLDLFQTHNTYVNLTGSTTITPGVWTHVAGVFDGTQMRVYLNGVQNGTLATTSGPASGTGSLHIGRFSYSLNPYYFNGLIDDARVSNAALYTSNFTPSNNLTATGSTKGLWKFNVLNTNDTSGNNNHGTVQGGATYSNDVPGTGGGDPPQVRWLVTDHLGTPRMVIDQTGTLTKVKRHDYLPFGEELFVSVGGRTAGQGYSGGDGVRQQFTQYERDNETDLDYAQARYFSSISGRFSSPDPYMIFFAMNAGRTVRERRQILQTYISEPRNWNHYAYCVNDPVNLVDPLGLIWLTKDNENYRWVDDDKYRKEDWEGYTEVEPGTIAFFGGGWGGYEDKYKHLVGRYVTLEADGTLKDAGLKPDDPYEAERIVAGAETFMQMTKYHSTLLHDLAPAYVQLEVDAPGPPVPAGPAFAFTLDRHGNFYTSGGAYGGTPGFNVSLGWLTPNQSAEDIEGFLTGHSGGGSVISSYGVGGGVTRASGRWSPQVMGGTPGVSGSYLYTRKRANFGSLW